jgi:hypothetical protein
MVPFNGEPLTNADARWRGGFVVPSSPRLFVRGTYNAFVSWGRGEYQGAHAMRPFILIAVSAIALSAASFGQANAGTSAGAAGLRDAAEQLRVTEPVARVCREVCRENFCRTRCFYEHDRDEVVRERVYRGRDRDEYRERRPGVELRVPGVSIEGH